MGQSQISNEKQKEFISAYHTKNLDENLKDYSSYRGIKSNTQSINTESPTNETSIQSNSSSIHKDSNDLVEVEFIWKEGGNEVFLTGSFVNWKQWFNLEKKENQVFSRKIKLPKEAHFFKFIVDKEWKASSFYNRITDEKGNINNSISLSTPIKNKPQQDNQLKSPSKVREKEKDKDKAKPKEKKSNQVILNDFCSKIIPERSNFNSEAPNLPESYFEKFSLTHNNSFLKGKSNLNSESLNSIYQNSNCSGKSLIIPPHVNLNHCLVSKSNEISGVENVIISHSTRVRHKFVTLLYYKPKEII